MYGMIHQALRDMALQHIGETEWNAMLQDSGFRTPLFIGMEYYPDETTMALTRMVATRLDMPMDQALEKFGHVWIDFAGASEYGRILEMAGDDLLGFLDSLDRMHASIRSNMPKAEMPSFELLSADAAEMHVMYRSTRKGLEPFVQGILHAVAVRFNEQVTVSYQTEDGGVRFILRRAVPHE
jgi:hypothetical protein